MTLKNYTAIGYVLSLMLLLLSFFMLISSLADLAFFNEHAFVFFISAGITIFCALTLFFSCRRETFTFTIQQGIVMTVSIWFIITFFAALPFYLSTIDINFTDSFFEAMSGLTTTGATVLVNLDTMPKGLLLWRSLLQWIGGVGIIFTAIVVLPLLKIGGMELFPTQSNDLSEKKYFLPRKTAFTILGVYLGLTFLCMQAYDFSGMTVFDSINHAMTTIAIGGFSTHDSSMAYFNSEIILCFSTIFMISGSLPFIYYVYILQRNWPVVFTTSQPRVFIILLGVSIVVIFLFYPYEKTLNSFISIVFNTTSVMTGTGYSSSNFSQWGEVANLLFFILMFTGGCAGSAACGIKIFRLEVAFRGLIRMAHYRLYPRGVFSTQYNDKPLSRDIERSVFTFIIIYFITFIVVFILLQSLGLDTISASSAAASALSNLGPGLGDIVGPSGNHGTLDDSIKWTLAFTMLIGRLEIIPVIAFFCFMLKRRTLHSYG